MELGIVVKKLSTIDGSPTLANLDRLSEDNLEPFFISIGEICIGFHANSAGLASRLLMTVTAVGLLLITSRVGLFDNWRSLEVHHS